MFKGGDAREGSLVGQKPTSHGLPLHSEQAGQRVKRDPSQALRATILRGIVDSVVKEHTADAQGAVRVGCPPRRVNYTLNYKIA
jgi:hypothetical protein